MTEGLVFDGSSIPGYTHVDESDQPLIPDPTTTGYMRVGSTPHAYVFCDACSPDAEVTTDSRTVLKDAVKRTESHGYAMSVGAEIEFFLMYPDGSPADAYGYCQACNDVNTHTMTHNLVAFLEANNIPAEKIHKEVAAGQYEVVLHHADPVTMADYVMLTRHLIKLFASEHGLVASFAPKPYSERNGSAMHVHFSITDVDTGMNMFAPYQDEPMGPTAQHFMAGILHHIHAGTAFLNPTHNSFDRLQPGYEAPVAVCWSQKNRTALIRLPYIGHDKQHSARAEIRSPDSSSNPYLVFSFLLNAGTQGIRHGYTLPEQITQNVFAMSESEQAACNITMLPTSQREALHALLHDPSMRELCGDTFTDRYIAALTQ